MISSIKLQTIFRGDLDHLLSVDGKCDCEISWGDTFSEGNFDHRLRMALFPDCICLPVVSKHMKYHYVNTKKISITASLCNIVRLWLPYEPIKLLIRWAVLRLRLPRIRLPSPEQTIIFFPFPVHCDFTIVTKINSNKNGFFSVLIFHCSFQTPLHIDSVSSATQPNHSDSYNLWKNCGIFVIYSIVIDIKIHHILFHTKNIRLQCNRIQLCSISTDFFKSKYLQVLLKLVIFM